MTVGTWRGVPPLLLGSCSGGVHQHRTCRRSQAQFHCVAQVVGGVDVAPQPGPGAGQFDGAASVALAAIKKAVDQGLGVDLDTGLKIEEQLFAPLFATEDRAIGLTSFLENGPGKAEFVGR